MSAFMFIILDYYFLGLTYIIVYVGNYFCLTWLSILPFSLPKTRGNKRIGPHNIDILSMIYGSLLGDSYASRVNNRSTTIVLQQENSNIQYLEWFYKILVEAGYCKTYLPTKESRIGPKGVN